MSMLRNLREKKGLTISQLAAKASISSRVIIDYEEGRQSISLNHAKLLAKALWVGIEDLMPPAGSIPPPSISAPQASPRPTPVPAPATRTPTPTPTATITPPSPATSYRPASASASDAAPPRYEGPRTVRATPGDGLGARGGTGTQTGGPTSGTRGIRPTRPAPPPPGPITEGQMEELQRLAAKLEITQEQLEQRVGKAFAELNRPEAKEWIKRARAMVEEIAPSRKAPYGQWPDAREDQEATYLKSQQEAGNYFVFKLFNGDQFDGVISDFTPYTITIKLHGSNDEMVLRKLAVAYYRQTEAPTTPTAHAPAPAAAKPARTRTTKAQAEKETIAHNHATDDHHQPLDTGIDSDRAGEPNSPEADNIDEDRGV